MSEIGSITGQITLQVGLTVKDDSVAAAKYNLGNSFNFASEYTFGTASNQANKQFQAELAALANGAPVTYLLEDGSMKDAFGGDFDPNAIKAIAIIHLPESLSSDITISGLFLSNNNLGTPNLDAGGTIYFERPKVGFPVIASDSVILTNNDVVNPAMVKIVLIGDDL